MFGQTVVDGLAGFEVEIKGSDTLILYSDGINEATNQHDEEFGEDRIKKVILDAANSAPAEVCERIMNHPTPVRPTISDELRKLG